MSETNIQVIIGRLTRDAKLTYTKNAKAILEFDLAWNHKKRSSETEVLEEVYFYPCVVYGGYAEKMQWYLQKGKQVSIIGTPINDRYQDKQGNARTKFYIKVRNIQLLGSGSRGMNNQNDSAANFEENIEETIEETEDVFSPPERKTEQEEYLDIF